MIAATLATLVAIPAALLAALTAGYALIAWVIRVVERHEQ